MNKYQKLVSSIAKIYMASSRYREMFPGITYRHSRNAWRGTLKKEDLVFIRRFKNSRRQRMDGGSYDR